MFKYIEKMYSDYLDFISLKKSVNDSTFVLFQNYSVRVTQLAVCIVVCDQSKIPTPGLETGLVLAGTYKRKAGSVSQRFVN